MLEATMQQMPTLSSQTKKNKFNKTKISYNGFRRSCPTRSAALMSYNLCINRLKVKNKPWNVRFNRKTHSLMLNNNFWVNYKLN